MQNSNFVLKVFLGYNGKFCPLSRVHKVVLHLHQVIGLSSAGQCLLPMMLHLPPNKPDYILTF